MPRVKHVKKAAKDNAVVKKGEPYYWWKFRYGGKHMSATYPRSSQLTQSKWSGVYSAQESIEDAENAVDLADAIDNAIDEIQECADEYEEADEAMGGHQGQNYERAEHLQELVSELQNMEVDARACADWEEFDEEERAKEENNKPDTPWNDIKTSATELEWDSPC